MSRVISPSTGRAYGVQRVCRVWRMARSSFYVRRSLRPATDNRPSIKKRGRPPGISDEVLSAFLRHDLVTREGTPSSIARLHRKAVTELGAPVAVRRVARLLCAVVEAAGIEGAAGGPVSSQSVAVATARRRAS